MSLLKITNLGKSFGGVRAVDGITFEIQAGELLALIGPNGAGKSTTFNMVTGLLRASDGQVRFKGRRIDGLPSREIAKLGVARTFQHVKLVPEMSVLENVALGAHLRGKKGWIAAMLRRDRHEEAALLAEARKQIERCGLMSYIDTPAASLPLGQQRVVEIARALAAQPTILLLDEPAAGLRHLEKQALTELLTQLRGEGMALLVVEHDMEFVMNLADRITVLEFGKVIAIGNPAEVQANPRVMEAYLGVEDTEGAPA